MPKKPEAGRWKDGVAFRGSWHWRLSWTDPATGERHYRMQGGYRTKAEALAARSEARARLARGGGRLPSQVTLGTWLGQWLEAAAARVRPTTLSGYRVHVRRYLVPRLGRLPLSAVDAARVRRLHGELLAEGLSPATVQRVHATLRAALQQAVRDGLLLANPASRTAPPTARRPELVTWSADEARTFLAAARGDRLHALWRLLLATGLRRGEALGLRWEDVDLERGCLHVRRNRTVADGRPLEQAPKTQRSRRTVPLDGGTLAALREHAARQAEEARAAGEAWQASGYVFVNGLGLPLHPDNVSAAFRRLVAGLPVRQIRLHDLRHTCATLSLAQGVHPKVVADVLGHESVKLTLDTYSHAVPTLAREAVTALGMVLDGGEAGERGGKTGANAGQGQLRASDE